MFPKSVILIFIVFISYLFAFVLVKDYPQFSRSFKNIIGGVSGPECQHITSVSRTISKSIGTITITHTFTTSFDKGVYNKGETATITTTLDPGLSDTELFFISGNQINFEAKIYQGTFDGTTCTGQLFMTVPHSIDKNKLKGTGKVTITYTELMNYALGCTCIRIDVLGMPITVDPFYFQIETLDSGTTTTSTETTSSTSVSTTTSTLFTTSSTSTSTTHSTSTSTIPPISTTISSETTTSIETTSPTTSRTTTTKRTTTTTPTTTNEEIIETTYEDRTSEEQPVIEYKNILIIFFVIVVLSVSVFFVYHSLKPNKYELLKQKWSKR